MNNSFSAKQFYYVMIAAVVLSFGGIIGAFYWGDMLLQSEAAKIADLQTDRDLSQEKIVALHKAKQTASKADEAKKLLDDLLPQKKEQEKLVVDVIFTASSDAKIPVSKIGALTFSSGTEPSDLSGTEQLKEIPGVFSYPFNLTIQDIDYDTLLIFLEALENNGRLIQIDDIQISPDKNSPGQISSVALALKAFLKP